MSSISTHVLDTARGLPAEGLRITLSLSSGEQLATGVTNADGRIPGFLSEGTQLTAGTYRMHFDTGAYFTQHGTKGFYPYVDVVFELAANGHYHVPLLLSPWGFSTYRGS